MGYGRNLDETTFSKVRERMEPEIMEELNNWIVEDRMKGRQLKLMSQDSTDVFAYSRKDQEAKWGHRTPSRKEQLMQNGGKAKGKSKCVTVKFRLQKSFIKDFR